MDDLIYPLAGVALIIAAAGFAGFCLLAGWGLYEIGIAAREAGETHADE